MRIIRSINKEEKLKIPVVLTVGNYDGFHKGHKKIITETIRNAKKSKIKSCVVTFTSNPINYLKNIRVKRILSTEDKLRILEKSGVDIVVLLRFNRFIADMKPLDFINYLNKKFSIRLFIAGWNFRFGKDNKAGQKELLKIAKEYDFQIQIEKPIIVNKIPVSSSLIRKLIKDGNINTANNLLCRNYYLCGKIVRGDGIAGNVLLTPTINVYTKKYIIPGDGIYAVKIELDNKLYNSVCYIGRNPTLKPNSVLKTIECHILSKIPDKDFDLALIYFFKYIRGEKKFMSLDELKGAIKLDKRKAVMYFQKGSI